MGKTKPLVFISHKHSDSAIATVVAKFLRDRSLGQVDVFLSSNWTFRGPRFGAGLNGELQSTLWNTDVLILVYTTSDQDWSYCMWECGVATHPDSPNTRIIVFQCGHESPTPFANDLRLDARKSDHVRRFTKQFLSDETFFPSRKEALAPDIAQETVEKAASELFDNLKDVLPEPSDGQVDVWPVWPFLCVELQQPQIEMLEDPDGENRTDKLKAAHQIIKEYGTIVKSDARAAQLFGLTSLPEKIKFCDLLDRWKEKFPTVDATWFDSCCEQIKVGARRGFPVVRQSPLKEVTGESEYTPVLSRVKRNPFGGSVQFDLYFYNLSDPKAVLARSRMIPKGNFFFKDLGHLSPGSIRLRDLVSELTQKQLNRVPVLDGDSRPLYIVHRSMIDKFVAGNYWRLSGTSSPDFTLADLLAEPEMKDIFETTFVAVSEQASLAEAKCAMIARPGCSDVFVTENGKRDEPVLGWLTNVDMARSS